MADTRIGQSLENFKSGLWAAITTVTCVIGVGGLLGLGLNAVVDAVSQTLVFQTTPVNQWWVIFALEGLALALAVIGNLIYWGTEGLLQRDVCPANSLFSPAWVITGCLLVQFPNNALFTALNIVFFAILTAFAFTADMFKGALRSSITLSGLLLSITVPAILLVESVTGGSAILAPLIQAVSTDMFVQSFRSILFGIPLVVSIALITQEIMLGTAIESNIFNALSEILEYLGYRGDTVNNVRKEELYVVTISVVAGVLLNLVFYWLVLGDPLMLVPGYTIAG